MGSDAFVLDEYSLLEFLVLLYYVIELLACLPCEVHMFIAEHHVAGNIFQSSLRDLIIWLEEGSQLENFPAVKEVGLESAQ